MLVKKIFLIIVIFMVSASALFAMSAEEIIEQRDDNEYYTSAYIEAEMIVEQGRRSNEMSLISISEGDNALTEFTNPADRGTKFLKRGDNLYMFFPDAEDIVQVSGHMLNENMMGSDFSYQDMMEADKLTDLYDFELLEDEEIDGRDAYVIEGIKKDDIDDVQYYRRKIWVDKERYIALREELYAQSGRILKEARVLKVEEIDSRWFPMESVMEDKLKKDTETRFIVNEIEFDPEIEEGMFSLESL